jgi:tetratricopeptide (TPR) repeat protein
LQRKAQLQRSRGQFEDARKSLAEAIRGAAAALADLHGTLGGTLRQEGRLAEAAKEYDRGYQIEQRYEIVSSYNALNRLLTRLLAQEKSSRISPVDMGAELRKVQILLDRLSVDHPEDYWAAGDLALVGALLGDAQAMKKGLALFTVPSTPASAYETYLNTLAKLLDAGHPQSPRLRTLRQGLLDAKPARPTAKQTT